MKHIILIIILVALNASCGNGSKQVDNTSVDEAETTLTDKVRSMDQEELKNFLSKTTPLTEAEFKEAFPKSIKGMLLDKDVEIINQQGYGTYGKGKITLSIHDGAGKNNGMATLFGTVYNIKAQDNDDTKYSNQERDAIKTINTYRINRNQSEIVFLYHNRWYVVLKGDNMSPDELWASFDLNALKNFK